jgi:hypothetical protein
MGSERSEQVVGKRIGALPFLLTGVALFVVKFLIDRLVALGLFGRRWALSNYLIPLETVHLPAMDGSDQRFLMVMLTVATPFVIIGVIVTQRRLRDAGLPAWLGGLFFFPLINLLFFAVLSVLPRKEVLQRFAQEGPLAEPQAGVTPAHPSPDSGKGAVVLTYGRDAQVEPPLARWMPRTRAGSALLAALAPVPITLGLTFLSANVLHNYGWALFIGMPFLIGMLAAVLHSYREQRTLPQSIGVAMQALVASSISLIVVALEGLICVIMLMPLAIPVTLLGAWVGHAITAHSGGSAGRIIGVLVPLMPLLSGAEAIDPSPPRLFRVISSTLIDAPPHAVWPHVIEFGQITAEPSWLFRTGIAYPVRARIEGDGVGAIRYCEFSTGPFIEPITVWDEPYLLKFDVVHNPPPMKEWSPFDLHPPHLDNFLVSRVGQFKLIEVEGGRTRLEGTTWYHHRLWPEEYWRWWSDWIIHQIHDRVLQHVRQSASGRIGASP